MNKIKRFSIILLSILTIFSFTAFGQIPDSAVLLGDKGYDLDYANNRENLKEISKQINEAQGRIFVKINGKWYENKSGKEVSTEVIPKLIYKDGKGKLHDYAAEDGEEIILKVTRVNFISANEIEVYFSKSLDKEAAENKNNYKINEKLLGENDKVTLKEDNKTVLMTLNEERKDKSECNIIISKNITDLNKNGLQKDYSNKVLVLSKEKYNYNSIKEYKKDVNMVSDNEELENCKLKGNLYIGGDEITLDNVTVEGTIYVDPGVKGSTNIKNVEADNIVILSGAENSIHLDSVKSQRLEVASDNKVRVESKGSTAIGNTIVHTWAIIDSVSGSFGKIVVSIDENSKNKTIELRGTFKDPIIMETGGTLKAAENANIAKVEIATIDKNAEVELDGNFKEVEINKEAEVSLVKCEVEKIITNAAANLNISKDSKVKQLDKKGHEVAVEGDGNKNIDTVIEKDTSSNSSSNGESNTGESHSRPTVNLSVSNKTIEVGQTLKANVKATSGAQISYSSNNTDVAIIDAKGTITGIKVGTVTIKVRATKSGYRGCTKTFEVTVTENVEGQYKAVITPSFPGAFTNDVKIKSNEQDLTGYQLLYGEDVIAEDTDGDGIVKPLSLFFNSDTDKSKLKVMKDGEEIKVQGLN